MTKDEYICEELTQRVNIIILKRNYKFTNKAEARKLISLICRSVYIDYYRSINKKYRIDEVELDGNQVSKYKADDIINRKEEDMIMYDKLSKLTEKQSDAILLRIFFGLSYKQIAKLMKCSFNTALSHVHYARKKLNNN